MPWYALRNTIFLSGFSLCFALLSCNAVAIRMGPQCSVFNSPTAVLHIPSANLFQFQKERPTPQRMAADCSSTPSLSGSKLVSSTKLPHGSRGVMGPLAADPGFHTWGAGLLTAHLPLTQDSMFMFFKKRSYTKCKGKVAERLFKPAVVPWKS